MTRRCAPPGHGGAVLTTAVTRTPGRITLHLLGEVDVSTVQVLSAALDALLSTALRPGPTTSASERIEIDASSLTFLSAHGAGLITGLDIELRTAGRHLAVVDTHRAVRRTLRMVGPATVLATAKPPAAGPVPGGGPGSRRTALHRRTATGDRCVVDIDRGSRPSRLRSGRFPSPCTTGGPGGRRTSSGPPLADTPAADATHPAPHGRRARDEHPEPP